MLTTGNWQNNILIFSILWENPVWLTAAEKHSHYEVVMTITMKNNSFQVWMKFLSFFLLNCWPTKTRKKAQTKTHRGEHCFGNCFGTVRVSQDSQVIVLHLFRLVVTPPPRWLSVAVLRSSVKGLGSCNSQTYNTQTHPDLSQSDVKTLQIFICLTRHSVKRWFKKRSRHCFSIKDGDMLLCYYCYVTPGLWRHFCTCAICIFNI